MCTRLLILSCSRRKKNDPALLPALERYDGPAFRVVRKFRREVPSSTADLQIRVLSARFGLIPENQIIPNYDQELTEERAAELKSEVSTQLNLLMTEQALSDVFIHAGKTYLQALSDFLKMLPTEIKITVTSGPPGRRLSELRAWLYADLPVPSFARPSISKNDGLIYFKNDVISLAPTQILDIARQALKEGKGQPTNYYSWYVLVDDTKVAPKWLISQAIGYPTNAFNTGQALRVLAQLGIEVIAV